MLAYTLACIRAAYMLLTKPGHELLLDSIVYHDLTADNTCNHTLIAMRLTYTAIPKVETF